LAAVDIFYHHNYHLRIDGRLPGEAGLVSSLLSSSSTCSGRESPRNVVAVNDLPEKKMIRFNAANNSILFGTTIEIGLLLLLYRHVTKTDWAIGRHFTLTPSLA